MSTQRADKCMAHANGGYAISNYSASYPPTTCMVTVNGATTYIVAQYIAGSGYQVLEAFTSFDTSAVPDGNIVTYAVLSCYITSVNINQTANCWAYGDWYDYGASLTTADYFNPQTGNSGTAWKALIAGTGTGWNNLTLSSPRANINKTGETRLRWCFYYSSTPYPTAGKPDGLTITYDSGDSNEMYLTVFSVDAKCLIDEVNPSTIDTIDGVGLHYACKVDEVSI